MVAQCTKGPQTPQRAMVQYSLGGSSSDMAFSNDLSALPQIKKTLSHSIKLY